MSKIKKEKIEAKGFSIEVYTEDFKNDYMKTKIYPQGIRNEN